MLLNPECPACHGKCEIGDGHGAAACVACGGTGFVKPGYFHPKNRSDVINLLQNARWRFSQINQTADGQAEPKLIEVWAADGFNAVQKVLDWIEERPSLGRVGGG